MLARWPAVIIFGFLLLAGCAQPPDGPTGAPGSSQLEFAQHSKGERIPTGVQWTFWIRNNGTTPSVPAVLQVSVSFSNSRSPPSEQNQSLPTIAPGAVQVLQLNTPYVGFGDYFGIAELHINDRVVARDFLFYEKCTASQWKTHQLTSVPALC